MTWEFWIDVGGTFTDCFGRRPDSTLVRHKLLSSGVTKGRTAAGSTRQRLLDPARQKDPPEFYQGYRLTVVDAEGREIATRTVARFDATAGALELDQPLESDPPVGTGYELASDEESPVVGIRYLLGLRRDQPIGHVAVRLGTTRGTNALITRRGARTALVTTRGFGDILKIGYQNRPHLFELAIHKRQPLDEVVVEIDERITPAGEVLRAPNADEVRRQLAAVKEQGIESLAICLLHAYAHGEHEQLVTQIAREVGFEEISTSSLLAPLIKIVARGDTTVMDAYLNPILRQYVARLRDSLGDADLRIMTSAGGLVTADRFVGKDSILSGPAGGVVGFSRVAQTAGFERAIGFDMGGTSTDVSRFDGRYELEYETEKAGVRVVAPMMAIETVAAGGGSVCWFDGVKLVVGPDSAGANPGPACYGRGGPLAVTDLNFYLGKIPPECFPFPLDRAAVEQRLNTLCREIEAATGTQYTPVELADGFTRVANANMVKPIRSISIAKGYDPRDYVLVSFGGAAAQHACAVARELGMTRVLNHPDSGILSAYGIGLADVVRHKEQGVYRPYSEEEVTALGELFDRLAAEARNEVRSEGVPDGRIEVRRSLDLRYRGVDAWLTIAEPAAGTYAAAYEQEHERLYGYTHAGRALEIVAIRVEVIGRVADFTPPGAAGAPHKAQPQGTTTTYFHSQRFQAAVFQRTELTPGAVINGPAIIHEQVSTTVIDPGWQAQVLARGELVLRDLTVDEPTDNQTDSAQETDEEGFELLVQMELADSASIAAGSPVRAAGVMAGKVVDLQTVTWRGEKIAQARIRVATSLGAALRDDLSVMIGEYEGAACIEFGWPGAHGAPLAFGQILEAVPSDDFATDESGIFPSPLDDDDFVLDELDEQHMPGASKILSADDLQEIKEAAHCDPVMLEIFNNQFAGIAEQMGITLRNTSSSVNVKERLDFSCAVFTAAGDLVVNAPHIPVHLGAMSLAVKAIIADNPAIRPGDVFITNDPYRGGSHLPDVTVITPVHETGGRLLFFTASRAHHAEIGGKRAGSMPPFSHNLAEEGVLIRNVKLVDGGQSRFNELEQLLSSGPYPTRSLADNLADISAQVAANNQGVRDLQRMIERYSLPTVEAYMQHIQDAAERKMRRALANVADGRHEFTDHLDDGSPIHVAIDVRGDSAVVDFTGTGPVLPGNLNANLAIVNAAVMYVMRLLIDEDIPLNQGVLAPLELIVPECLLNPLAGETAETSPAVVGGNVETSQRVVDTLLGALGIAAASQGTMNNLLFGDATFGYYETICGGSGATPDCDGADAVHTHMTNTRLTDPEVLELRYPVRLHEFSIRRGSGGSGQHRGGDGIVRRIEFLRPLDASILSQRRGPFAPYGIRGGSPGALGRNTLVRADGTEEVLPSLVEFAAQAGDVLTVETPGGGGCGEA